jgi:hypothetical protein
VIAMQYHCYACGREIADPRKAVAVLVVEAHTGRLGSARLHAQCCCQPPSVAHYFKQVVQFESTISNLAAFKNLHRRLADANGSASGSVPVLLA